MKKLIAITLCLVLTLLACACAASNATVSAPESTDNKGGNTADLSTMEQPGTSAPVTPMSSQPATSDEVSKPTEPKVPEEKETTLEKILSFDIGMDGMFEYGFIFYDDPSDADLFVRGALYPAADGTFYHTFDNFVVRVNDGVYLPFNHEAAVRSVVEIGNFLYVLDLKNNIYQYDLSAGLEHAILLGINRSFASLDSGGSLHLLMDGEIVFRSSSKVFYTMDKKEVTPFAIESNKEKSLLEQAESGLLSITKKQNLMRYFNSICATQFTLVEHVSSTDDQIFTTYGTDGNVTSRFLMETVFQDETPCKLQFEHYGEVYTLQSYSPVSVTIESYTFDTIVQSRVCYSADGTAYLAVYHLDRCDVYLIKPGYSNVQFSDGNDA